MSPLPGEVGGGECVQTLAVGGELGHLEHVFKEVEVVGLVPEVPPDHCVDAGLKDQAVIEGREPRVVPLIPAGLSPPCDAAIMVVINLHHITFITIITCHP